MKPMYRVLFVILCALVPAAALSAQERPLLTDASIRNFVKNYDAIGDALGALDGDADMFRMEDAFNSFSICFGEFLDEETDFSALRGSYMAMRDLKSSKLDKIFSGNGMGGYRDFAVIFAGVVVLAMEEEVAEAIEYGEDELDFDAAGIQTKIARMRALLHPADMTVLKNNMETLREVFN